MTKFTIEDLRDIAYRGSYDDLERELALQLLASMEQAPVYLRPFGDDGETFVACDGNDERAITLYAAPQLPQPTMTELEQFAEFMAAESIKSGDYPDGWQCKASNAAHEYAQTCRAAMLHGAEPVTTVNKLPFEQWLSQQTGTIDVECGCVMTEVFFHWLRVAYEAGNSPVIQDGYCIMPLKLTADNGAKGALCGEFHVQYRIVCQSCVGEGCEDCNHTGGWDAEIPVGWDTIKRIHEAAVEACAMPAAPQQ
ncbi:hypothetical protein JJP96_24430, partial [Enterobacter hormaechei]|nr:hypothetical protein [Enterobacter hormaechei]MBK4317210.1 hypothetical protein [Enterobacter hormaechei]